MLEQLVAARLNLAPDSAVKGKQNEQKFFLFRLSDQTDQTLQSDIHSANL